VKTDKKKLFEVFWEKAYSMAGDSEVENRARWEKYLESVGCRIVATPGGLLPFHSPGFLHLVDPFDVPSREHHIQIPKETALRILAIGLP
jgi:hypothetical protein